MRARDLPSVERWLHEMGKAEEQREFLRKVQLRGARPVAEAATTGVDEALQGIGSDGYADLAQLGLRWPYAAAAAPSDSQPMGIGRYLAVTSQFEVADGARRRIRGCRMLRKIGWRIANGGDAPDGSFTTDELLVQTPGWRFRDGAISYHLREIPKNVMTGVRRTAGPFDTEGFAFRMAQTPALLYQAAHFPAAHVGFDGKPDFYVNLDGYVPPNFGRPWGNPIADWGTFYDERAVWNNPTAWQALDVTIEGPCTVALFVSCLQTNAATRSNLPAPGAGFIASGTSPEEAFLLNYTHAAGYNVEEWRVATGLVWEAA